MPSIENIRPAFEFSPKPCMLLLNNAPTYTIAYVNRAFIKVVDCFVDNMIGRGIFEAFPAREADREFILHLLKTRLSNEQVYPIVEKDKSIQFFVFCPLDINHFLSGCRIVRQHAHDNQTFDDEHYQTANLLESITDAFFAVNHNDKVTYWNKRAEEVMRMSRVQMIGVSLWEIYPEIKLLRFYTEYEKARAENLAVSFDEYFPRLDLWLEITIYPSSDGLSFYLKNINERINSEKELVRSEQRFKSLVQEGADLIGIIDKQGKYLYVSPTSEKVLNISPDFFIGKIAFDFIHAEDKARVFKELSQIGTKKRVFISPYRFAIGENSYRWIETVATDLSDEPTISGIVVNSRDVTERIENELKIKQTIEHFNIVSRATSDAIYDVDLMNDHVQWNRGITGIFGYSRFTHFDIDWWYEKIHPEDVNRVKDYIRTHVSAHKSRLKSEYRFRCANGSYKNVLDRSFLVFNDDGMPIRMIGALQDISEKVNYISAIEDQNVRLREISWMQSHLVRAPLARIMGLTELLSYGMESEKEELIIHLLDSANELDKIIRDIVKKTEGL